MRYCLPVSSRVSVFSCRMQCNARLAPLLLRTAALQRPLPASPRLLPRPGLGGGEPPQQHTHTVVGEAGSRSWDGTGRHGTELLRVSPHGAPAAPASPLGRGATPATLAPPIGGGALSGGWLTPELTPPWGCACALTCRGFPARTPHPSRAPHPRGYHWAWRVASALLLHHKLFSNRENISWGSYIRDYLLVFPNARSIPLSWYSYKLCNSTYPPLGTPISIKGFYLFQNRLCQMTSKSFT